ncbi:cobyric acid synthase [Nitrospira sp. NS4]|uniref:cobyric acid synthase n=1 Tax=Nitrospira sp. NS4 TaxID=3414498 RepID=UPI003C30E1C3
MRARALAVLGTGSDVGKSLLTSGLCRLFLRAGVRVAPFKAQNMSNNSYVTPDGNEIGRAQALQAQACGLDPDADMNPVLMKPESDRSAQIVVQGKVWGKAEARTYFQQRAELAERVRESYERLANRHELIVIEGAGSAAEMNLRDRDLANWSMVELADAQVVLVADIDRGGVFAQVIGTLDLLAPQERQRVIGIIINKFRGDATLFEDGVTFIEQRTGLPVIGVVPMLRDLVLDEEDSVEIERARHRAFAPDRINIAVVLLPRMSNFTDFARLAAEEDVILRYVAEPRDLPGADIIVIPGTKNTIDDLRHLRQSGFSEAFRAHTARGGELLGICGGYQMLGRSIADPEEVESGGVAEGFGWLDVTTRMLPTKVTHLVEAQALHLDPGTAGVVRGYYIHMGETERGEARPCFQVRPAGSPNYSSSSWSDRLDGAMNNTGFIWGTYIHGVFDQPGFRRAWLNQVRRRKGWPPINEEASDRVSRRFDRELDRWADHLASHLRQIDILRIQPGS